VTLRQVILEGGENGASKTLQSLIKSACPTALIGRIYPEESFPQSTAINPEVRKILNRTNQNVHPRNPDEAIQELHRRGYYPRSSRKNDPLNGDEIARWPGVLRACIEGGASLALSSLGAALFSLQRNLIGQCDAACFTSIHS
jgi:DNA mismatch repair protein MSH6